MNNNKRKKTSWIFRMALLLLCLVLITTCLVSGMLARYSSSSDGDTGARVAYFDVTLTSADDGKSRTVDCKNDYDATKNQTFTVTIANGTNARPSEVTTNVDVYVTLSQPLVRDLTMSYDGRTVTHDYDNSNNTVFYTANGDGSVTYCFKNVASFGPGQYYYVSHTLQFVAATDAVQPIDGMKISVKAIGTQVD